LRRIFVSVLVCLLSVVPVHAQNSDDNGDHSDPDNMKTYRYDMGILNLNIEASGVSQQASNVILPVNKPCTVVVSVQSNSDLILDGYRLVLSVDGKVVVSQKQDGMRPHQLIEQRISYTPTTSGRHILRAQLQPLSQIDEDNPRNNQAAMAFTVEAP
jgi:subtilase family serine protease